MLSGSIATNAASAFPAGAPDDDADPFDDEHPATAAAIQAATEMTTTDFASAEPLLRGFS
jgi:hypothetical protein